METTDRNVNHPNEETIAAIEDVRNGRNVSQSFSSVQEWMVDLNTED